MFTRRRTVVRQAEERRMEVLEIASRQVCLPCTYRISARIH